MAAHGSPDGTTPYLLLMVVDTYPIRLQHPIVHSESNNEESKLILGLSWIARDMKRTYARVPGRLAGRTPLRVQVLPIVR
jgi:hypothetical protein